MSSPRASIFYSFTFLVGLPTAREAELRQLRKSNMEFEERNAALQKHVESMRTAVEKLEVDVIQERSRNTVLQQHLESLRQALTTSFAGVPLPGKKPFLLIGSITSGSRMRQFHLWPEIYYNDFGPFCCAKC